MTEPEKTALLDSIDLESALRNLAAKTRTAPPVLHHDGTPLTLAERALYATVTRDDLAEFGKLLAARARHAKTSAQATGEVLDWLDRYDARTPRELLEVLPEPRRSQFADVLATAAGSPAP